MVRLTDTIKIHGTLQLRASAQNTCTEECTLHGKCVADATSETTCLCACGWSGTQCSIPPVLQHPLFAKHIVPEELPGAGGRMNVMMDASVPNVSSLLSSKGVEVMVGYSVSLGTPQMLSSSQVFTALAPKSNGRYSNNLLPVYLAATSHHWCHLPQSTPSKNVFQYYNNEHIDRLYGACKDGTTPYLGSSINAVKAYDQLQNGVCGSDVVCLNQGKSMSKPCKCNCGGTTWAGFDCGLCSVS